MKRTSTEPGLDVASGLSIPLSYVTGTAVILGQKRSGKSYKASVLCEELLKAAQQVVVMDPTSSWWGLRSSSDGKRAGFPITIFGGEHGDLPLDPASGAELARAIVCERFSAIIDFDGLTQGELQRFSVAFLETAYRLKKGEYRTPMHMFIDEADMIAPQRPLGEEMRMLGACQAIVRRGGIKGFGITMITQRPAELSKGVLSQCDTLIAIRLSHPADMKQIDAWVGVHGDPKTAKQMMEALPNSPRGAAWVWSPMGNIFGRFMFRDRETFDSGRTPEVGKVVPPKIMAPVDIRALEQKLATSVIKSKESDPKHLQAKIRELTAALEKGQKPPVIKTKTETRMIEILKPADLANLKKFAARLEVDVEKLDAVRDRLAQSQQVVVSELGNMVGAIARAEAMIAEKSTSEATRETLAKAPRAQVPTRPVMVAKNGASGKGDDTDASAGSGRAEQQILSSLAWWESIDVGAPSNESVAFIAGYTVSGHFANMRGKLKTAGLIEYPGPGVLRLTEQGRRLAPASTRPRTLDALHNAVFERLDSAKRKILTVLIDAYPKSLTSAVAAEQSGYTVSGHFANMRGRLSTLGLVTYPRAGEIRASDLLFPEALS